MRLHYFSRWLSGYNKAAARYYLPLTSTGAAVTAPSAGLPGMSRPEAKFDTAAPRRAHGSSTPGKLATTPAQTSQLSVISPPPPSRHRLHPPGPRLRTRLGNISVEASTKKQMWMGVQTSVAVRNRDRAVGHVHTVTSFPKRVLTRRARRVAVSYALLRSFDRY